MGVDTKGCVVTEEKDVFKVVEIINNWWQKVKKQNNISLKDYWKEDSDWSAPRIEVGISKTLSVYFKYKGEDRRIFINLGCDCDLEIYEEIKGDSCIWFSIGYWGSSVEIMQSLMEEFKEIGQPYVDDNDCDDVEFYKI